MSIPSADGLASYDNADTEFLDLEDVMSALLLADNFLLGRLKQGAAATETKHSWPEDALNSPTVEQLTSDTTLNDSDTSLVVASGQGALLAIGALLKDVATGAAGREVMQVTAISTDTLTVTRGFGGTTAVAHGDPAVAATRPSFRILSQPKQENDKNVNDRTKMPTTADNYTQIFKYEVEVSGTSQAVKKAGVAPGGQLSLQLSRRNDELMRELGTTIYHGVKPSATQQGSDAVIRSMDGIRAFLAASGGNIDSAGGAMDEAKFNALFRLAWDDGGDPQLAAGAAAQISRFSALQADKIRIQASDTRRGYYAESFLTDVGREVELLVDRWIQKDELALLDMNRVARHDLRAWRMEPLAKIGDGERAQLIYEGTLSVKNGTTAHAIAYDLTVPA